MAIIKMQKVAVIGLEKAKSDLIAQLMDLEAVELTDQTDKLSDEVWAENVIQDSDQEQVSYLEAKIGRSAQALDVIDQYGGLKSPLFKTRRIISRQEASAIPGREIETEDLIAELIGLNENLRAKRDEINRIDIDDLMFQPWQAYDVPLDQSSTEFMTTVMGVLPQAFTADQVEKAIAAVTDLYVMKQVNEDKAMRYLAILLPRECEEQALNGLKDVGFQHLDMSSFQGTVCENIARNNQRKEQLQSEIDSILSQIVKLAERKNDIEDYQDLLTIELDKQRTKTKLLKTDKAFFMEGWVPEKCVPKVKELLDANGCYYEFRDPLEGEDVPVALQNKGFFKPIEAITEMYSLPSYGTFDPTTIYSLWYICFFGMMFSDACYGLIMIAVCGLLLKKFNLEGTTYKMVKGFFYCGISTFFWGVMFGGWFGNLIEVVSETFFGKTISIEPILFDPLDDPLKLLIISLGLGVAHIFLALGIKAYILLKDGKVVDFLCDVVLWYTTIIGLIMWLGGGAVSESLVTPGKWIAIVSIAGLALTGGRDRKGAGKLVGGFSNVYSITSYLSDILSYARILALGLATGAIAQVVNTMGSLAGGGVKGAIIFILVFLFGHLLNFAINALGAFIHSARLQYVEFFGKFYEDGGEPFDPLRKRTKYIKIENN